jgi:hypothetical protein
VAARCAFPRGLVVVTGGSGYIAGYCIAQLLNEGWRVRTTARNLGRAEEVRATIGKIAANGGAIEFAAADLNSDAGLANAVAGADYVLHVASPVPTVDRKRCEDSIASSGSATRASYVPRANLVGIQNWRRASTTVGISRHGTVTRTEFGSANLQFPVRAQAAVAARHVRNASSRRTRSVWRDVRWRWTLNVLWTAA